MLTTIHPIYPSSKVAPEVIADYGWTYVETIPTTINDVGRLAPTEDRSALHVDLRQQADTVGKIEYETAGGEVVIARDFAIAISPENAQALGFFALS